MATDGRPATWGRKQAATKHSGDRTTRDHDHTAIALEHGLSRAAVKKPKVLRQSEPEVRAPLECRRIRNHGNQTPRQPASYRTRKQVEREHFRANEMTRKIGEQSRYKLLNRSHCPIRNGQIVPLPAAGHWLVAQGHWVDSDFTGESRM